MTRESVLLIAICAFGGSFATLVNRAKFGDTMLEYYDNYDDVVVMPGAMARCRQRGGWLVMPKYHSLDAAVSSVSRNANVWIGVGDFGIEGAYEFIDGSRITWENWRDNEPNNYEAWQFGEDCAASDNGVWNDLPCDYQLGYVCQIPNSHAKQYEYSHFKVYQGVGRSTYENATTICHEQNSRLVRVNNAYSFKLLTKKLTELTQLTSWVSKYKLGSSPCYAATWDGVKVDNCKEERPFICEAVEPHDVKVSDEEIRVESSSDLQIHCSAFGFPTPEVTWFRNEIEVNDQVKRKGHSTMKLHDLTIEDGGVYVCRATNVINEKEYHMEAYSVITG